MATYELTTGTREEFNTVQAQMISDFTSQITGAEVTNQLLGTGKIVSCLNPCNNFESIIFTVHFDLDETKSYGASVALATGSLKLADESLVDLYNTFMEAHANLKHQLTAAILDDQRREKDAKKLEKKRKDNEKKMAGMKASAERELDNLINSKGETETSQAHKTEANEFYYTLGWLAKHVGTITAKMPDYLEDSFVGYFGDVERTVVDSTKVGPSGYTSQWRLSMEASLKKAESIPMTLIDYLGQNGKKVSKTSFVWSLVDDYGFKFGKNQDIKAIRDTVPYDYRDDFDAGMRA